MGIFQSTMSRENSFEEDTEVNNNELKTVVEENHIETNDVENQIEEKENDNKEGFFSKLLGKL